MGNEDAAPRLRGFPQRSPDGVLDGWVRDEAPDVGLPSRPSREHVTVIVRKPGRPADVRLIPGADAHSKVQHGERVHLFTASDSPSSVPLVQVFRLIG